MRGVSLLIVSKFYHILMVSSCAQWQPLTTCPILLHWWNNSIIQFILPTILPSFHLFKIQNPHNIETMLWKTNYNYWFIPPSTWRWLWIFCDPAACTAPVACIYHSKVMTSSSYPPCVIYLQKFWTPPLCCCAIPIRYLLGLFDFDIDTTLHVVRTRLALDS